MKTHKQYVLALYTAFDLSEFELVRSMMSDDFIAHLVGMPATLDSPKATLYLRQAIANDRASCASRYANEQHLSSLGENLDKLSPMVVISSIQ